MITSVISHGESWWFSSTPVSSSIPELAILDISEGILIEAQTPSIYSIDKTKETFLDVNAEQATTISL